jgi:hypothetical protein
MNMIKLVGLMMLGFSLLIQAGCYSRQQVDLTPFTPRQAEISCEDRHLNQPLVVLTLSANSAVNDEMALFENVVPIQQCFPQTQWEKQPMWSNRVANQLVDQHLAEQVLLLHVNLQEDQEASIHQQLTQLKEAGVKVDFILWQQTKGNPVAVVDYMRQLQTQVKTIRSYLPFAPILLGEAAICAPTQVQQQIHNMQKSLSNDYRLGIFAGVDLDQLRERDLDEQCRFTEDGYDKQAQLWIESMQQQREVTRALTRFLPKKTTS